MTACLMCPSCEAAHANARRPRGFVASYEPWPPADLDALRELAPAGMRPLPWPALFARFPGRTRHAILLARRRLKLASAAPWTPPQDRALAGCWGRAPRDDIAAALAPHPWREISARAIDVLGLDSIPQGYGTVRSVAAAMGYDVDTFTRLLRRQRVPIYRHAPRLATQRGWRIVVVEDARAAVDRDCATETVTAAAARLGVRRRALADAVADELLRKSGGVEHRRGMLRRAPGWYDRVAKRELAARQRYADAVDAAARALGVDVGALRAARAARLGALDGGR